MCLNQEAITRDKFHRVFLDFLRLRNGDPSLYVGLDENLFNLGLLDSFGLVHLLDHLARELGREPRREGGVEAFFTINRAFASFSGAVREG